jgi:hypothetical protein
MVLLNQLVDNCIPGLPICNSPEKQWPQGPHTAHQLQSGLHEGAPCLQLEFGVATQTDRDASGMPPYLRRKLARHGGTALFDEIRMEVDRHVQHRTDDLDELRGVRCSVRGRRLGLDTFRLRQ